MGQPDWTPLNLPVRAAADSGVGSGEIRGAMANAAVEMRDCPCKQKICHLCYSIPVFAALNAI